MSTPVDDPDDNSGVRVMKFGITIPRFQAPDGVAGIGPQLAGIARDADQAGLDSLWVMDHFFQIPPVGPAEEPMLEGYSALAYVAGPYEGKDYQLVETLSQPMPLSTPHPRILIGGGGEQKTLRLVAGYADACNLFARPGQEGMSALSHKLDVLRVHCEAEGRAFEAIEKTVMGPAPLRAEHPMAMAPEAVRAFVEQLEGLGIDHYIVPIVDRGS